MKKVFTIVCALALSGALAVAQTAGSTASGGSQDTTKTTTTKSSKKHKTSHHRGGKKSVIALSLIYQMPVFTNNLLGGQ